MPFVISVQEGSALFTSRPHRINPIPAKEVEANLNQYRAAGLIQHSTSPYSSQCVLYIFSKKYPPNHVTQDDVSTPLQRLEVETITGHQSERGRGGVFAAMYETHWTGLSRRSWERELHLELSLHAVLLYRAGNPHQHRQTNRLYRRIRIGEAKREVSRSNGERSLAPGYGCVSHADCLRRYCNIVLPNGANSRFKSDDGLWWLEKISAITPRVGVCLVRHLDDLGPIKLPIFPARYTTSTRAVRGS